MSVAKSSQQPEISKGKRKACDAFPPPNVSRKAARSMVIEELSTVMHDKQKLFLIKSMALKSHPQPALPIRLQFQDNDNFLN